jgi:AbrB family looped-hinge helix DNA binding protein
VETPAQSTRLSTKGQIVLPLTIRASRAWKAGTEFVVEETGDGILLRPVPSLPETTLDMVAGCLRVKGKPERPKTLPDMRAAIEREVKRRSDRSRS